MCEIREIQVDRGNAETLRYYSMPYSKETVELQEHRTRLLIWGMLKSDLRP